MRILMVSQFWTPEPFLKALPFARELMRRGHEVEVLTGWPNYPGGEIYKGYRRRLFRRETVEGARVNRVWLYPSHDGSGKRRILNYISFAMSALVLGPWVTRKPDVIYVYHPPATAALPAKWISFLKGAPIVYDIQDLWPDSVLGTGMMPRRLTSLLEGYCAWVHRKMDRIAVLSPGFKKALLARGVAVDKVEVIPNWCDEDALRPVTRKHPEGEAFTVLFAGTMGIYQSLETVIEAARQLLSMAPTIRFQLVGSGIERTRLQRLAEDLPNVQFLEPRPMDQMPELVADADALLVHLKSDPLFEITIPSKTQAYLFAGRPILMGVRGDAADIVRRSGAGITFEPEDGQSLVQAVIKLHSMSVQERESMGAKGAAYYKDHMSILKGVDSFELLFAETVVQRRHPTSSRQKVGQDEKA